MKRQSLSKLLFLAAALAVLATGSLTAAQKRPTTLSPSLFKDDAKAMAAYQVAKDIPEILEQLPCFCGCDMHFGHKNNLYCFTDRHGSACDMCEEIALTASDLHKKGYSLAKIKQVITERFSGE